MLFTSPSQKPTQTQNKKMAIEIFPDSPSLGMSPRISFSHDLQQSEVVPIEQYIRTSSPSDFDFCVFRESFDLDHSSSADELFFDGKILPIEIKKRLAPTRPPPPLPPPAAVLRAAAPPPKTAESEEKQKSFWRFKRSTSLNCGSGYGRTLCPLPLLSRSNSTGSSVSGKRPSVSGNQAKQSTFLRGNSSKQTQTAGRPPLKKNHHASNGSGIRFNPLLHVPPANFFGLGSFFSGGGRVSGKKKH